LHEQKFANYVNQDHQDPEVPRKPLLDLREEIRDMITDEPFSGTLQQRANLFDQNPEVEAARVEMMGLVQGFVDILRQRR
jgi:hypothetical protein